MQFRLQSLWCVTICHITVKLWPPLYCLCLLSDSHMQSAQFIQHCQSWISCAVQASVSVKCFKIPHITDKALASTLQDIPPVNSSRNFINTATTTTSVNYISVELRPQCLWFVVFIHITDKALASTLPFTILQDQLIYHKFPQPRNFAMQLRPKCLWCVVFISYHSKALALTVLLILFNKENSLHSR